MRNCTRCGQLHNRRNGRKRIRWQSYCASCHAAFVRQTRPAHSQLSPEQRKRSNARAYSRVLKQRAELIKQPCKTCGSDNSQMHHEDYNNPRRVEWLCRKCHLDHHYNPSL